jgi:polysaccharide deacetylase family sporulation protein PdaB
MSREDKIILLKAILLVMALVVLVVIAAYVLPEIVPAFNHLDENTTVTSSKELPIYCVDSDEPQVAISFDCAWGDEYSERLLEILDEYNVKATFFMTGQWVEKYPETVKKIVEKGHELGNHSETHPQMSALSKSDCEEELKICHDKVLELTGIEMNLFRPPYGDYNDTVINAATSLGYYSIQWDVDSLDWKDYGAASIITTICENSHLGNGSIILMHNGAKYTTEALPKVLEGLESKGYELVLISELIYKDNYEINVEGRQYLNSEND